MRQVERATERIKLDRFPAPGNLGIKTRTAAPERSHDRGPGVYNIAVVIPVHNEVENIEKLFKRFRNLASTTPLIHWNLIFVDDGSTDETVNCLIRGFSQKVERLKCRVVELSRNFGKEAALAIGFAATDCDLVATVDADLQDPPELIPLMLETLLATGADVVCGRRQARNGEGLLHRLGSHLYYRIIQRISQMSPEVDVGDFRLMRREVVQSLSLFPERSRFMKSIYAAAGFRRVVFPYDRQPRAGGRPKLSFMRLVDLALDGIIGMSIKPLRISTYLGVLVSVFAFGYIGFIIYRVMAYGRDVPGYASLMVVLLTLNGLQFLLLGLLGEYVGRVLIESKQRPIAIVRRDIDLSTDVLPETVSAIR